MRPEVFKHLNLTGGKCYNMGSSHPKNICRCYANPASNDIVGKNESKAIYGKS